MVPDSSPNPPPDETLRHAPLEQIIEQHWALVLSVCRAHLADVHEAEDAAQETFIKLMRHRGEVTGNVGAWLSAVARTTAIDHVRRAIRQRARRENWIDSPARAAADPRLTLAGHAAQQMLSDALLEIEPAYAELLTQRYLRRQPLRVLARQHGISVATASRRCTRGIEELGAVLSDMGVFDAESLPIEEFIAQLGETSRRDWSAAYYRDRGLQYATQFPGRPTENFPGRDRPLRVGSYLSHYNEANFTHLGFNTPLDFQARASLWINHPGVQVVAVVEPDTSHHAPVETTLRDFELNAGLIDITDVEALGTLDVLIMPNRLFYHAEFLRPVLQAVRGGVGLFQEGFCAGSTSNVSPYDPEICEYLLARPPVTHRCTGGAKGSPGHNLPVPGKVVNPHPAFPWLGRGQHVTLLSCGAIYEPAPHATAVVVRDEPLQAQPGSKMPAARFAGVLAGQIGRGRAVIVNMSVGEAVFGGGARREKHFVETLSWLAPPDRELEA